MSATNLSLDAAPRAGIHAPGINMPRACEYGPAEQIAERWLAGNEGAITASNAHVDAHGLPLARHRLF